MEEPTPPDEANVVEGAAPAAAPPANAELARANLASFDIVGVSECLSELLDDIDARTGLASTSDSNRDIDMRRSANPHAPDALIHVRPSTTAFRLGGAAHAQIVKEVGSLSDSALARLRFLTRCDALLHGDALRRVQRESPHCTAAPEL